MRKIVDGIFNLAKIAPLTLKSCRMSKALQALSYRRIDNIMDYLLSGSSTENLSSVLNPLVMELMMSRGKAQGVLKIGEIIGLQPQAISLDNQRSLPDYTSVLLELDSRNKILKALVEFLGGLSGKDYDQAMTNLAYIFISSRAAN